MTLGVMRPIYAGEAIAGNGRTRPCECGGWISAIIDEQGLLTAVWSHRFTAAHQRFYAARVADGTFEGDSHFPQVALPLGGRG